MNQQPFSKQPEIQQLKEYFKRQDDVSMAFVFGSYARGREMAESDFDVAIYLKEGDKDIKREDEIWSDITEMLKKEVDMVCLNYAPATLVSNVMRTGIPLAIKDKRIYWEVYLRNTLEAEDFLRFLEDFWRIKQRARSLSDEDKPRLLARIDFLKTQMEEFGRFQDLTFDEYQKDIDKKRIVERWAENIVNASIDIAKIILASEKRLMPKTYEEALRDFGILSGLTGDESKRFARFAHLRNILAHEYLEILYESIREFIKDAPPLYKKTVDFLDTYLSRNMITNPQILNGQPTA